MTDLFSVGLSAAAIGFFVGVFVGSAVEVELIKNCPKLAARVLAEAKLRKCYREAKKRITSGEDAPGTETGADTTV